MAKWADAVDYYGSNADGFDYAVKNAIRKDNMENLRISAKNLGQVALEDFCPRCYWIKLKVNFKMPFSVFPGIFSSIDGYTKKVFHHIIDSKQIPPWMAVAGNIVGYEPVKHWSKNLYHDEKSGITLSGMPDDIWVTREGTRIIPDAKTALKTNTQDKLLPMYEIQEIVYSILVDSSASLCLVYMEPQTGGDDALSGIIDRGFAMQFSGVVVPIENDKSKVRKALTLTRQIVDLPSPPVGNLGCKECKSLDAMLELLK
jgi:hypothetical protein